MNYTQIKAQERGRVGHSGESTPELTKLRWVDISPGQETAKALHCTHIRSFSGPYFPACVLNTDRDGVSLLIQSECRKIRTRITPNTDSVTFKYFSPGLR